MFVLYSTLRMIPFCTGYEKREHPMDVLSFMLALPIFPGRLQPSIVGRSELNFRVRDGNGWTLALISTNCVGVGVCLAPSGGLHPENRTMQIDEGVRLRLPAYCRSSPRAISTGQLHTLPCFHLLPINQIVFLGPYSI